MSEDIIVINEKLLKVVADLKVRNEELENFLTSFNNGNNMLKNGYLGTQIDNIDIFSKQMNEQINKVKILNNIAALYANKIYDEMTGVDKEWAEKIKNRKEKGLSK